MFQPVALDGRKLNIHEKAAVVALRDLEISVREIAQQMICSRNTVKTWICREKGRRRSKESWKRNEKETNSRPRR